jgi:hypothetical protein
VRIAAWQNFYVITGSAAGALTGLMFVVIALTREQMTSAPTHARRSFATPTIVHFTSVLLVGALLAMPHLSVHAVGWLLVIVGVVGLAYMTMIIHTARRLDYTSDFEDTLFHFTLPPIAHANFLAAGVLAWSQPAWSLYMVAGSLLTLLIVGIHNAWDSAMWFVTRNAAQ